MGKKIKRPRIQVLENHRYGDWYDETSQGTVVRHNKLMWLAHCLVWFKRTLKRGLIISRGWHWTLLLYPEQEGKKDQTPWKTQKEWRKATCKYAGGTWKDCQGCFLQCFFTAIIVWQEEITFAMRRLGLGLCLTSRLWRCCYSFLSGCRGGQRSSVFASAVRHEPKPLPFSLTPCIFIKQTKMSL